MSDTAKRPPQPFDRDSGYSGQGYHRDDEDAMGRAEPAGRVATTLPMPGEGQADTDLPDDNGRRAWVDSKTGEVHGSGAGAGGGNRGDEIDEVDPATPPGAGQRSID